MILNDLNKIDGLFQLIEIDCIKLKKTVTKLTGRMLVVDFFRCIVQVYRVLWGDCV